MNNNSILRKSKEEIFKKMENCTSEPNTVSYTENFELPKMALEVKLTEEKIQAAEQLRDTINGGREEFIRMIGHLARSIDEFRKSNEKTSKVMIALTAVIGFTATVQAITLIISLFKIKN